jgi:hypothetical protein
MKILTFVSSASLERGRVDIAELPLQRNLVSGAFMQLWYVRKTWPTREIWLAGRGLVRITHGEEEEKDGHGKAAGA